MSGLYWILDGHTPVEVDSETWGHWFAAAERVVERTVLSGGVTVSTVFLGLDHGYGSGPPVLFETMVFHDGDGRDEERYSTWDEAEAGHWRWVARVTLGEGSV